MSLRAVLFDLGGVVLGSPLHAIARYERELGLPANFVNQVVAETAPHGAWARLERGELTLEEFYPAFEGDCAAAGGRLSARRMFAAMADESLPREIMLEAIRRIRERGLQVGALTNNWAGPAEPGEPTESTSALRDRFDVFIESSVEGLRKPDPRIYKLACERLAVEPAETAFLDDIGANLKPARALGMATIKVEEPGAALRELSQQLGFDLIA